jgi:hypothetical protein
LERVCPNEVSRVRPLGRVPWLPLYRVRGQVTYREIGSPDGVVVSMRERKLAILACKEGYLVLASTYVRPGVVVVIILCPRHSMVWRDVTVLVVMELLARWWFTSHGLRHRLLFFKGHHGDSKGVRSHH